MKRLASERMEKVNQDDHGGSSTATARQSVTRSRVAVGQCRRKAPPDDMFASRPLNSSRRALPKSCISSASVFLTSVKFATVWKPLRHQLVQTSPRQFKGDGCSQRGASRRNLHSNCLLHFNSLNSTQLPFLRDHNVFINAT